MGDGETAKDATSEDATSEIKPVEEVQEVETADSEGVCA